MDKYNVDENLAGKAVVHTSVPQLCVRFLAAQGGLLILWSVCYCGMIFVDKPIWHYDLAMLAGFLGAPVWALMSFVLIWAAGVLVAWRLLDSRVESDHRRARWHELRLLGGVGVASCAVSFAVAIAFTRYDVVLCIIWGYYSVFGLYIVALFIDFVGQLRAVLDKGIAPLLSTGLTFALIGMATLGIVVFYFLFCLRDRFAWWLVPSMAP